jgi:hypothetical protein
MMIPNILYNIGIEFQNCKEINKRENVVIKVHGMIIFAS